MKRRVIGIVLVVIGILFLLNNLKITGAVIGMPGFEKETNIFALFFITFGILLITAGSVGGLERELAKPMPGKKIKGDYVPLTEIIARGKVASNKISVEVKGNQVYRDGRPIQGLTIDGEYIEFLGCHFTSSEAANIIENDNALLIKNHLDPYVYLLEPMDYAGKDEREIRHLIGSNSAEECVVAKVRYPLGKVFIKVEKGRPTHYAIDGDVEQENLMPRKGKYMHRKKLEEL